MVTSYATIDDVRSLVDTDMSDAEIDVIIDVLSPVITNMMGAGDSQVLRGICMIWGAYLCMLKDPASRRLGEYAEDRTATLEALWAQVELMIESAPTTAIGGIKATPAREELA